MQELGESLMLWAIRVAVACMYFRWLAGIGRITTVPSRLECWLWTLGCLAYLIHVASAFQFVHHWSHTAAWQHTADETRRISGIARGDGLWVNYLFTAIWLIDCWRLIRANRQQRPTSRRLDVWVFWLFLFMVFNATVVFGPSHYLPIALVSGLVALARWQQFRHAPATHA
jgi:hypothetical protein